MKNLVVLTGAGMSAESGISTFRDAGGLWDKYPVEQVATPEGYQRDPALVINFYNERRKQLLEVKPTEWSDYVGFGSYSDAKYMFIMDVCQRVWDDLEDEDIDVIKQAYREYKEEGNPPILGEEGDEIEYE